MDRRVAVAGVVAFCVAAGAAGWWYLNRPRYHSVGVSSVVVTGDGDLVVTVRAGAPPCEDRLQVDVEERPERVRLAARLRRDPSATCPAILRRHTVRVTLDEPLGDRPVWDAHHDRGIVVSRPR